MCERYGISIVPSLDDMVEVRSPSRAAVCRKARASAG